MWGAWFALTAGATVGLVLLIGALALTAWSPIFAVLVFIVVGVVLAAGAAGRRSSQYVEGEDQEAVASRHVQEADVIGSKAADRGAPAQGEGASSGAETLPPPTRP